MGIGPLFIEPVQNGHLAVWPARAPVQAGIGPADSMARPGALCVLDHQRLKREWSAAGQWASEHPDGTFSIAAGLQVHHAIPRPWSIGHAETKNAHFLLELHCHAVSACFHTMLGGPFRAGHKGRLRRAVIECVTETRLFVVSGLLSGDTTPKDRDDGRPIDKFRVLCLPPGGVRRGTRRNISPTVGRQHTQRYRRLARSQDLRLGHTSAGQNVRSCHPRPASRPVLCVWNAETYPPSSDIRTGMSGTLGLQWTEISAMAFMACRLFPAQTRKQLRGAGSDAEVR